MQDNETRELESTVTHSHTETDPRTLRDGQRIEELRATVDDVEYLAEELDELMLEVLERLEDIETRLTELEGEPDRTDAQVIDAESPATDGPWGAANGAAERLEGER